MKNELTASSQMHHVSAEREAQVLCVQGGMVSLTNYSVSTTAKLTRTCCFQHRVNQTVKEKQFGLKVSSVCWIASRDHLQSLL